MLNGSPLKDRLLRLATDDAPIKQWQIVAKQLLEDLVPGSSVSFQPSLSADPSVADLQQLTDGTDGFAGALGDDWWWLLDPSQVEDAALQSAWGLVRKQWRLRSELANADARAEMESWLISSISHDLRSPLAGIMGILDEFAGSSPPDSWVDPLDMGRQSAQKMLQLLNQVLDFYRLRAERLTLAPAQVNLLDLVGRVCTEVSPQARSKGLELSYRLDPKVPVSLSVDPQRLEQVMINLLANAIKFTDQGQVVLALSINVDDRALHLEVRDTGMGIAPAEVATVFLPFRQTNRSEKTTAPGVGLGLNIVDQLVRLMGGHVGVESQLGEGTVFTVELPLEPADDPLASHYASALSGHKVLVIDNNAQSRDLLAQLLGYLGAECRLASSGPEGVFLWSTLAENNGRVDQILINSSLNGVGATETLRQIREHLADDEEMPDVLWLSSQDCKMKSDRAEVLAQPVTLRGLYEKLAFKEHPYPSSSLDSSPASKCRDLAGTRILVVDDTPLNLTLASIQLGRLGIAVTTAESGVEALALLKIQAFDLIFMDIMMPDMDGYETTGHIREWQRRNDKPLTPIVALTANALQADLSRCRAAGMDDFLAKPYRPHELGTIVRRQLGRPESQDGKAPEVLPGNRDAEPNLVDWSLALKLVGNDTELLVSILGPFLEELPETLNQLEQNVLSQDFPAIQRRAHSLKGMLKTFGAVVLAGHAQALEHSAGDHDVSGVLDHWQRLNDSADATRKALVQFQKANS